MMQLTRWAAFLLLSGQPWPANAHGTAHESRDTTNSQTAGIYTSRQDTCPTPAILRSPRAQECPLPGRLGILPSIPSSTLAWSQPPHCLPPTNTSRLDCLFTLQSFRNGHGTSVITSTTTMSDLVGAGVFVDRPSPPAAERRESTLGKAYRVQNVPGRGKGVVAARRIRQGEILMVDVPAVLVSMAVLAELKPHLRRRLIKRALEGLPAETRQKVEGLQRGEGQGVDALLGTNTESVMLGEGEAAEVHVGLFAELARINHSCRPNAYYRFSQNRLTMEVVAYRTIEAGQEVLMSYTPLKMKRAPRREYLQQHWNFNCDCPLCHGPEEAAAESEERRTHIDELRATMQDAKANGYFGDAIAIAHDWRDFCEWEDLPLLPAEFYDIVAELHFLAGDWEKAATYARMAVDGWVRFGSVDGSRLERACAFLERASARLREALEPSYKKG